MAFETLWTKSDKSWWEKIVHNVKEVFNLPSKEAGEVVSGGVKKVLGGVTSALTPTFIWIAVVAIVALIIFTKFRKLI